MTDRKMAEKPSGSPKNRHALRNVSLMSGGLAVAIVVAMTLLNHNPPGAPPAFTPVAGVLMAIGGLIAFIALTILYMKRTDEHDVTANLWGLSMGCLFFVGAGPVWWILNHSGLVGPVNFWAIYFISAVVAAGVWAWFRFR